jgi:DNA-directed RNA polymerase specialized sigma subunit
MIAQQTEEQLWAKVDALGEPGRSLLVLTYREGLNSQEIADVLGYATPEVVRQLRKRCLDKLRK